MKSVDFGDQLLIFSVFALTTLKYQFVSTNKCKFSLTFMAINLALKFNVVFFWGGRLSDVYYIAGDDMSSGPRWIKIKFTVFGEI